MRFRDALVLLACTCLVGCDETKHTHYATGIDAVKDGAIARGWLPEVLSSNVVDIDESHDLDINHGKADFKYAAELIPKLQKKAAYPASRNTIASSFSADRSKFPWILQKAVGTFCIRF